MRVPSVTYNGDHDLAFATEKFANTFGSLFREFALNLCPAVCDAIGDKLKIEGFSAFSKSEASAVLKMERLKASVLLKRSGIATGWTLGRARCIGNHSKMRCLCDRLA
jgi:hypothetical protein